MKDPWNRDPGAAGGAAERRGCRDRRGPSGRSVRAAYVCADPGVPVFGRKGCSIHVQEVVRALQHHGARVSLFATSSGGAPPPGLERTQVYRLPNRPKGEVALREKAALAANEALRTTLQREGPFDLVYERYSLWSFGGMEYARSAGVPGLLEVNAPLIEEQARYRGLVDREGAEGVAERAFGAAAAVVAVSQEVAEYVARYPETDGKVHVVPNGVDPNRFPAGLTPSRPARGETFTVGFVGTLKPWHGLPTLVEAFERLHQQDPHARLLIVGDGPEREVLVRDLEARSLAESVECTGAVAPEEIPGLLASMDAAVAPYPNRAPRYFSPLKVYEYMAARLPVVASRTGQLVELIQNGANGLLVPPDDSWVLAAALDWLRREPKLRRRLGLAARETVLRGHTWDRVARWILELSGSRATSLPRCAGEV